MTLAEAALPSATPYLDEFDATPPAERWKLVRGWCASEPAPFFAELRAYRPTLDAGEVILVAKRSDVAEILSLPSVFTVELYKEKMGDFMLSRDETVTNYRDKAVMRSFLSLDDLPKVRADAGQVAADELAAAGSSVEIVSTLARRVPLRIVQGYFGIEGPDDAMLRWSFANQVDQFNNLPFDGRPDADAVSAAAKAARAEMVQLLLKLIAEKRGKLQRDEADDDVFTRVLKTTMPAATGFNDERVIVNVGGLLIGAIETVSEAVVNALDHLLSNPERAAAARAVAHDPKLFDGHVWEALRFAPIVAFMFRKASSDHVLAAGTPRRMRIEAGRTILPISMSAMFDDDWVDEPESFRPDRPSQTYMHFGQGHHECLGRYIGMTIIPEIVRQALLHGAVRSFGKIDYDETPFPQRFVVDYAL